VRLLLVEDDKDLAAQLAGALRDAGYAVDVAHDGEEGHFLGDTEPYDAIILDLGLPVIDGLTVLERWRQGGRVTPVLVLTARDRWSEKVAGFDAGADDYIPKPIRPRELQARLVAVARRPLASVAEGGAVAWAPAAEDAARSAFLRQVVAGESVGFVEDHSVDDEEDGQDGRDGMLELGMRFVGSWIEFAGLRINPARDLLVIDDLIVDVDPEMIKLIETMLYAGTMTLTARQLALRFRGENEEKPTTSPDQDRKWFDATMPKLLNAVGESAIRPRWFQVDEGKLKLVKQED
jgi:DNA-binding response OmpR family regulator